MSENEVQTIMAVINTLNQISIAGEGNIDKMYGVIIALRQLIQPKTEETEDE